MHDRGHCGDADGDSKRCQGRDLTFAASIQSRQVLASRRAGEAAGGFSKAWSLFGWRAGPSKVWLLYGDFVTTPLSLLHACVWVPDLLSSFVPECVNTHLTVQHTANNTTILMERWGDVWRGRVLLLLLLLVISCQFLAELCTERSDVRPAILWDLDGVVCSAVWVTPSSASHQKRLQCFFLSFAPTSPRTFPPV